ncbi:SH3 domain-containing protein, partial [Zoogloea sp.]|uniref:SH3 domain-containing protein n=1 Tax=Zoogloea sp. TaxID=49181 RepID=UPI001416683C
MPKLAALAVRLLILGLPAAACLAGQATLTRPDTLREQPSGFSGRIMEVPRRSTVEVLEVRQDWLRILAPGNRSGWILRQNTDLDAQLPAPELPRNCRPPLPATDCGG